GCPGLRSTPKLGAGFRDTHQVPAHLGGRPNVGTPTSSFPVGDTHQTNPLKVHDRWVSRFTIDGCPRLARLAGLVGVPDCGVDWGGAIGGSEEGLRVLLLGANGLIGSAVLARLVREGHGVRAVGRRRGSELPGVEWVRLDIGRTTELAQWRACLDGVDAVV